MSLISYLLLLVGLQQPMLPQVDSVLDVTVGRDKEQASFSDTMEVVDEKTSSFVLLKDTITYTSAKLDIAELRGKLYSDLLAERIDIDSVKQIFADRLLNQIIPYWYGTKWSFGGHTSVPKQGRIACGYFVSTTLKDMGLRLNRYKLAQKSPIDEALAIGCGTPVVTISNNDSDQAFEQIQDRIGQGVYFIGFDTGHVGFVTRKDSQLFLIHSNYLTPISVCIEPLNTARVFKNFTKFHLVPISHNDLFMDKWLNKEVLP